MNRNVFFIWGFTLSRVLLFNSGITLVIWVTKKVNIPGIFDSLTKWAIFGFNWSQFSTQLCYLGNISVSPICILTFLPWKFFSFQIYVDNLRQSKTTFWHFPYQNLHRFLLNYWRNSGVFFSNLNLLCSSRKNAVTTQRKRPILLTIINSNSSLGHLRIRLEKISSFFESYSGMRKFS